MSATASPISTDFPSRCWAEIELAALERNVRIIRRHLPAGITYISVVKANGYGLGAKHMLHPLKSGGARAFAVANIAEAVEVRKIEPELPILLLSATVPGEEEFFFEYNLTPTVSCIEEVQRFQEIAERHAKRLPVHLKFDTGMGRLGMWHQSANELLDAVSEANALDVRGIYSHFSSSGEDIEFTHLQRQRFLRIIEPLKERNESLLVHIDNSSGLATFSPDSSYNGVRVGLLQLGVLPTADSPLSQLGVSSAMSLHARISVVKNLPKGAEVSYGRTHVLRRDSRVAIVTAGYADGIPRACGNRGQVLVRGRRCPILGHVTMDGFVVDVTDLEEVQCGDRATIIGRQDGEEITINDYSAWSGTIPWESLCAISRRVRRVYR